MGSMSRNGFSAGCGEHWDSPESRDQFSLIYPIWLGSGKVRLRPANGMPATRIRSPPGVTTRPTAFRTLVAEFAKFSAPPWHAFAAGSSRFE